MFTIHCAKNDTLRFDRIVSVKNLIEKIIVLTTPKVWYQAFQSFVKDEVDISMVCLCFDLSI